MTDHGSRLCIVDRAVADGAAVWHVVYGDPVEAADSGFVCLSDDVAVETLDNGERRPVPPDDLDELVAVCVHCLVDAHPEIGVGLDEAQRTGYWTARP
jgi:hypothetical protein